jgi:glycosyltransferase involved in cell wall biosynthesis
MNLIVLSHMYPYEEMPYYGIFVKEQLAAVRKQLDGIIYVISPMPWAPRALWFRGKWRKYGMAGRTSIEGDVKVMRPRYLNMPGARSLHMNSYFMYLSILRVLPQVLKETGRENTLLHSHALLPDGLAGARAAKLFGLKSLCTFHGSDINLYPHYSKSIYKCSKLGMAMNDSCIAVSGKIKERALEIFPEARIDVITNGVNTDNFRPGRLSGAHDVRRIVFVGRLVENKGVRELLQAFRQIYKERPDTRLVLIGAPVMKEWILEYARKNGLEGAIEIKGGVSHNTLPEHYGSAYLFVLPSYSEGMPVSMFEAMAMRLPVVVSAVGGVSEVIRHGENGLLIKPRSVDDIVDKVSLLLDDPALAGRIAEAAFGEIRARYTWDDSARMLVGKYNELLSKV